MRAASIINITSIAGISPGVGLTTYRAAKAGVIHFSRCAAIELAELGVRVNVIAPGNISTDINAAFDTASIVAGSSRYNAWAARGMWRTRPSTWRVSARRRSPVRCCRSTAARRPVRLRFPSAAFRQGIGMAPHQADEAGLVALTRLRREPAQARSQRRRHRRRAPTTR